LPLRPADGPATTPTACVRGCVIPFAHVPPCTCTSTCDTTGAHAAAHCTGCQPRPAEHGLICRGDDRRARDHLGEREAPEGPHGLAWAYDHLVHAHPYVATPAPAEGGGKRRITDPEAERLSAVVALRADMHEWAVDTARRIADRHHLAGPDLSARAVRDRAAERLDVMRAAAWLLRNIDALEADPIIVFRLPELADLMSSAHALAPWRPAPTLIDGVPCRCRALSLHHHGDEVKCWTCARSYTLDEYAVLTKVLARRFAS
jgi:hypothetical protein